MKNIKLILSLGVLAVVSSCTDLDVDIKSQYTAYPENPVALEAKMADVYFCFREALGRRFGESSSLSSDEQVGISFGSSYYDAGTYANSSMHCYSPDDASIGWYSEISSGITKANKVLLDLQDADPTITAPARAMRAFYHFLLMDNYGDVPILETIPEEGEAVERSKRADVATFIAKELEECIPYLNKANDANTYGKPNRWMAEALLVKLYLNWPVYAAADVTQYDASAYNNAHLNDVVRYCDDIINSGLFSLEGGEKAGDGSVPANKFLAKFYPNNGLQIKDFIYAMPYDAINAVGFQYARPRIWRKGDSDGNGGAGYFGVKLSQSCGGNFSVSPECADRFDKAAEEGDLRAESVIGGQVYMYNPTTYNKTTTPYKYQGNNVVLTKTITLKEDDTQPISTGPDSDVNSHSQGYKSVKYFVIDNDYKNGRNQSNDLPIFRYADILLMKAEAILRGATATNGQTALTLINEVRAYSNAPAKATANLDVLLNERALEFFDENWRRNDMIRFGIFESEYGAHTHAMEAKGARFDKTCRILPIPTAVLNANTNWQQNAGY